MISTFNSLSQELRRRVYLMVGRAVLTVVDDSTGLQTVQVEALRGEVIDGAERMQTLRDHVAPVEGRGCPSAGGRWRASTPGCADR